MDQKSLTTTLYAFATYQVGPWWNFENHISPFTRIFQVLEGEQDVHFNGETHTQTPGNLYLTPPFTPVTYHCKESCKHRYFIFSSRYSDGSHFFSKNRCSFHTPLDKLHADLIANLLETLPSMGLENVDATSPNFNQMIFENDSLSLPHPLELQVNGVLSILLSSFIESSVGPQSLPFSRSLQHIEDSLHLPISMHELAAIEQLSSNYFSDQFKVIMGVRPQEYILQRRELLARRLLRRSTLTVSEIAERVGQKDIAYFSRIFKKRVGLSPNHYRKQV